MGKPVITGDSPAIRAHLKHGEHVFLCERSSPAALAEALVTLQANAGLRERLAVAGQRVCQEQFTPTAVGRRFLTHLEALPIWS
jgi:glycosyltransferase involved in cell wall biosynthesis